MWLKGFHGGSAVKHSPAMQKTIYKVGDVGFIPALRRSPGEGNGYPLQYSCLENPMSRGVWWATVHGVVKSQTRLSNTLESFLVHCESQFLSTTLVSVIFSLCFLVSFWAGFLGATWDTRSAFFPCFPVPRLITPWSAWPRVILGD